MTMPSIDQLRALAESWRSRANTIGTASIDADRDVQLTSTGERCGLMAAALDLDALVLAVADEANEPPDELDAVERLLDEAMSLPAWGSVPASVRYKIEHARVQIMRTRGEVG